MNNFNKKIIRKVVRKQVYVQSFVEHFVDYFFCIEQNINYILFQPWSFSSIKNTILMLEYKYFVSMNRPSSTFQVSSNFANSVLFLTKNLPLSR